MSKLDLIRAGHTEVADGQCGLCDVPWPCDVGKVLAEVERCYRVIRDSDTARIKMNHARIEAEEKLAAAEARAEQAERERDAAQALTGRRVNDAARLVDELTTLLYETLKAWQTQDGRHHQIVRCGACRRKADRAESVVHESDCPVYRLQQAEAANDAVIRANAEEIADMEDSRDAADARANAEWARAEMEQRRADVADLRSARAEQFSALWKRSATDHRRRANSHAATIVALLTEKAAAESYKQQAIVNGQRRDMERMMRDTTEQDNASLRERLAVAEELADQRMRHRTEQLRVNKRLRERLATVEAALIRLRAGCMVSAGTACRLCHGTWLREDGETAADHHDGCPLRETAPGAALAATPANDEIVLPELETRMGVGAVVSVSVRPDLVLEGEAAIPAAGEVGGAHGVDG